MDAIDKLIIQSDQQKKDVGFVDNKMFDIKNNIDELITQSSTFKIKNQQLTKKIEIKRKINKEK